VKIVAGLNVPIPYNSMLERSSIPNTKDIVKAVREVLR
jgi:pyruvate/2-oxoglutarate/acetoin dehydrogenase E1 component